MKSQNLSFSCKVDCLTKEMCVIVQKTAFENEITWWNGNNNKHLMEDIRYLFIDNDGLSYMFDNECGREFFDKNTQKQLTIKEFIQKCEEHNKSKITDLVGHTVEMFRNGSITMFGNAYPREDVERLIKEYTEFNVKAN